MTLMLLLSYLALGAVAGTLAGLFGIGGGLVIVPALAAAFAVQNVADSVIMHLAIGTSLATIVITGSSSAWGHYTKGNIRRDWFIMLLPGLLLGAVSGVFIADNLSSSSLGSLFGVFLLIVAGRMVLVKKAASATVAPRRWVMGAAGVVIGGFSALFGIGGGTLSVPWLSRCGASMTQAVGTSAACGMPIAVVGAATFIATGWGVPDLPAGTTGYVLWPAFLAIVVTSVPFARVGVRLASVLPAKQLKTAFAMLLLVVGMRFLF
ncbi:sulfite exporter TauE/SafE family protein [Halomonas halocynthiae]|uniref:sulfite exporter TauE/SafE family protein n=1 Tax=Halomonas halocynthiae TaxID=176290 RepID=UPI00042A1F50|nr:sulfite exporter TauE/SafE family protein [Halomonas halocynthiae]